MSANNRVIVAMVAVAVLAIAFWMVLLSPKRSEISKLDHKVDKQREMLSLHQQEVQRGREAMGAFPREYQQIVVLGKAAPADDESASLLVQLNRIARHAKVRFENFVLAPESEGAEAQPEVAEARAEPEGDVYAYPSPTEVAASTLPLGATIGPAGLAVMPYNLTFEGNFFRVANFIQGLDSLVRTRNSEVEVTGRLITINGFELKADNNRPFPYLEADFTVTTYLVPPSQGVTAGASPTSPEPSTTPVSTTIGGTP
jgi:Tfp pilus assembly protein PilO